MTSKPEEDTVTSRNGDELNSKIGENGDGLRPKFGKYGDVSKSKFGEHEDVSKFKFGENKDGSKSKFGDNFIQRCASCNFQMHESQIVYIDRAFCCHRCRAKVMALDRLQTNAATTESEDCSKEIISLINTEKPKEHIATTRNEDESKSQFGEIFIRNCALCNCQMHESQHFYMYNDQSYCCHHCRAKVMSIDTVQTYAARTEAEVFPKEIISLSNQIS